MKLRKINNLSPRAAVKNFRSQRHMARELGLTQQAVNKQVRLWDTHERPLPRRHHKRLAELFPAKYCYIDGQLYAVVA